MDQTLTLRRAVPTDLAGVDVLLAESYPRLLRPDYPPSTLVTAIPLIARARPELLASNRYFLALDEDRIVGAGGWSAGSPADVAPGDGLRARRVAHVRHLVTDHRRLRRGIARAIMERVFSDARDEGFAWMECLSTRTAVPFYAALGFGAVQRVDVPLRPGISFPAVRMLLRINADAG